MTGAAWQADVFPRENESCLAVVQRFAIGLPVDKRKVGAVVIRVTGGARFTALVGSRPDCVHPSAFGQSLSDFRVAGQALQLIPAGAELVTLRAVERTAQRFVSARQRAEEEMAHAHRLALEAARLRSEFLSDVSHEILTPLNGIFGMSRLLTDTGLSAAQLEYAEALHTSGELLRDIVADVLDFSHLSDGQLVLEEAEFDPHDSMERLVARFARPAQKKVLSSRSNSTRRCTPPCWATLGASNRSSATW